MVQKETHHLVTWDYMCGYLGGMLDGDGSVCVNSRCIKFCNTDWGIIKLVIKYLKKIGVDFYISYEPPRAGIGKLLTYNLYLKTSQENLEKFNLLVPECSKKRLIRRCVRWYRSHKGKKRFKSNQMQNQNI